MRRTDLLRLLLRAVVQVAVDVRWQRRLCSANGIICAQEIGGGSDDLPSAVGWKQSDLDHIDLSCIGSVIVGTRLLRDAADDGHGRAWPPARWGCGGWRARRCAVRRTAAIAAALVECGKCRARALSRGYVVFSEV